MKRLMLLVALIFMGATAMAQEKAKILVLIHSENGGTYELAKEVAAGIQSIGEVESVIKQVRASDKPALKDIPVATTQELTNYDGIAFGSPSTSPIPVLPSERFLREQWTCGPATHSKACPQPCSCLPVAGLATSWRFNPSGTAWRPTAWCWFPTGFVAPKRSTTRFHRAIPSLARPALPDSKAVRGRVPASARSRGCKAAISRR